MNRSLSVIAFASLAALLAGCTAASAEEDVVADESQLQSAAMLEHTTYEGTVTVSGAPYSVAVTVSKPAFSIGYQVQRGWHWHSDSPGCRTFVEATPVPIGIVVRDRAGRELSNVTRTAESMFDDNAFDREVNCPDGLLRSRDAVREVRTQLHADGVALELGGERVALPAGGYVEAGMIGIHATTTFAPLSAPTYSEDVVPGSKYSELRFPRGRMTIGLPSEISLNVGIGETSFGFSAETIPVTLRAK